jgi:hypothetical protein
MPSDTSHWTQHDTWPPIRLALSDENGLMDLDTAGTIVFRGKQSGGTHLFGGTATLLLGDEDYNAQYTWTAQDLAVVGNYDCECEITWDAASSPPRVESIGSSSLPTVVVRAELG